MNCRQCTKLLSVYVDDRATPEQRASIESHLQSCAACARELDALRRISTALTAADGAPPAGLAERLTRAALAAGRDESAGFLDRWIRVAWPSAAATAAAAAALVVAMASGDRGTDFDEPSADDPVAMVADVADIDDDIAASVLGLEEE